ncbi:hypothetical protein [Pontibacter vulgaris]|uniref:hypothetical protein n=1 Tax=Pontibacter vulgaris TaxID=2905679 RepID=UPI001FA7ED96|nr:hypothetical protein [Pontibacter vulgaris]
MNKDFKLSDIPKHNIYQVPEGYFDRLPMRVMERTTATGNQHHSPVYTSLWQALRVAVAPFILLLVFVGAYFLSTPTQKAGNASIANLPDQEIVDYLTTYAQVEATDLAELSVADKDITSDFLNISPNVAESELEYYQLNEEPF